MVGRSHPADQDRDVERERLVGFRQQLYGCFGARADALFELGDAVLCAGGPVTSLVELCQAKRFRRGHGALYDALACGRLDAAAVGRLLAGSWEPADEGPLKIAVDVSAWPRPDAETSPERCHCYHCCRCDGARKTIPGWPFSVASPSPLLRRGPVLGPRRDRAAGRDAAGPRRRRHPGQRRTWVGPSRRSRPRGSGRTVDLADPGHLPPATPGYARPRP